MRKKCPHGRQRSKCKECGGSQYLRSQPACATRARSAAGQVSALTAGSATSARSVVESVFALTAGSAASAKSVVESVFALTAGSAASARSVVGLTFAITAGGAVRVLSAALRAPIKSTSTPRNGTTALSPMGSCH